MKFIRLLLLFCSFSLLYACSESGKSGQVGSLVDSLVSPEYPGGVTAMIKFISQNLEYPKACQENGTQGRVGVRFIVGRDGTISNVNVLKALILFWIKKRFVLSRQCLAGNLVCIKASLLM